MPKWSGAHHHKDGLGKPKNIEEAPTMVKSRRVAKDAKQYLLEDDPNTTPSSRISEDARNAINGRSTITKATTTRSTVRPNH
ncbi:hypothetical protein B9Z55_014277 [Caenorhabditis nigoni]|uniref:Uncharacterized protein n=1 Tax=Caenorhabditis nigoni TaxID=1611254 RepID=A0A2G5U5S8_9PELO|nr:hypothetical protein B9Z55_014277 [Caenorhabditis nigoni]